MNPVNSYNLNNDIEILKKKKQEITYEIKALTHQNELINKISKELNYKKNPSIFLSENIFTHDMIKKIYHRVVKND